MAIQAHLVELERKHKILENELHDALVHLSTDDLQILELKRRKLMVKDEIERLRETLHYQLPQLTTSVIPAITVKPLRGVTLGCVKGLTLLRVRRHGRQSPVRMSGPAILFRTN